MATLNEKIAEVVNSNKTVSVKYFELINDLQLTHNDAANLLGLSYRQMLAIRGNHNATTPARPRRQAAPRPHVPTLAQRLGSYTFGVEMECKTSLRHEALLIAFQAANITSHDDYEHYNHRDSIRSYKIMRDGSVNDTDTHYGNEVVSPVLNNFDTLKEVCKVLNSSEVNATVDKQCGLHVHVGAKELSDSQYISVFVNYAYLEAAIDKWMAPSRRANEAFYARTLKDHITALLRCENRDDVKNALYSSGYNTSRYHKVNPESYNRHETIEFRQHQGTTNFTKIKNWVNFCKKLVEFSKTTRLDHEIAEIAEIPFLTATEKAFFTRRANEFAAN